MQRLKRWRTSDKLKIRSEICKNVKHIKQICRRDDSWGERRENRWMKMKGCWKWHIHINTSNKRHEREERQLSSWYEKGVRWRILALRKRRIPGGIRRMWVTIYSLVVCNDKAAYHTHTLQKHTFVLSLIPHTHTTPTHSFSLSYHTHATRTHTFVLSLSYHTHTLHKRTHSFSLSLRNTHTLHQF